MRFLSLDFEGSHKNPRQGCPVQLGVAVMDGGEVLASQEWIIQPPYHWKSGKPLREVDAYALRVSGLSLEDIETGYTAQAVCDGLAEFVHKHSAAGLPVVAFNISYDYECYTDLLWNGGEFDYDIRERVGYVAILHHVWICAWQCARRAYPSMIRASLDEVAALFDLSRSTDKHGALEDAILAGRVFSAIMALRSKEVVTS